MAGLQIAIILFAILAALIAAVAVGALGISWWWMSVMVPGVALGLYLFLVLLAFAQSKTGT